MADTFRGIITADGKKRQLPYGSVLDKPASDETLSIQGAFADSKAVGDKFKEVKTETDSVKEDIANSDLAVNTITPNVLSATKYDGKEITSDVIEGFSEPVKIQNMYHNTYRKR